MKKIQDFTACKNKVSVQSQREGADLRVRAPELWLTWVNPGTHSSSPEEMMLYMKGKLQLGIYKFESWLSSWHFSWAPPSPSLTDTSPKETL